MLVTCFSTAPVVSTSASAMPAFERPSAISSSTSRSRGVSVVDGARAAAAEQLRDDLGVERGAALAHAAHRVDEVGDVHHAVLEQVADPARLTRAGEQLGGVGVLDVLRDDEDRRLRRRLPQLERGAQALVAEGRRQADVDDRDVGRVEPDRVDERVGVVDGRDDLEAVRLEQPHHPVAQQREVLGDHDAHGSSARTIVGPPAGLVTTASRRAPRRGGACPARPLPRRVGAAVAVVLDLELERAAVGARRRP